MSMNKGKLLFFKEKNDCLCRKFYLILKKLAEAIEIFSVLQYNTNSTNKKSIAFLYVCIKQI